MAKAQVASTDDILATAQALRWQVGANFHEQLMEAIYTEAAGIADASTWIELWIGS